MTKTWVLVNFIGILWKATIETVEKSYFENFENFKVFRGVSPLKEKFVVFQGILCNSRFKSTRNQPHNIPFTKEIPKI